MDSPPPPSTRFGLSPEAGRLVLVITGLIGAAFTLFKVVSWGWNRPSNSLDPIDKSLETARKDHASLYYIKNHLETLNPQIQGRINQTAVQMLQEIACSNAPKQVGSSLEKIRLSIERYILFSFQTIR